MSYGHWGKALRVNLTTGEISVQPLDELYLRRYMGGWGFIAHTLLTEAPRGADPLGPDNRLIYATGPLTGQALAGGGRHMIGARSPLTGGFAGSEVGGYFGAELKRAGWDMIVFEGVSPHPVYLWINDDQVELRAADHLWGLETYDCQQAIRDETGERNARVSQCGIAGERLVLLANIIHDANRAAGRGGLGAVMGSKRLKAVAVRGTQRPPVADEARLRELGAWFRDHYTETGSGVFATLGTMRMVRVNQLAGGLPTRNFSQGQFDGFEQISSETMASTITVQRDTCFGCPVRCKWVVEVDDPERPVRREYGGPEYETTGALGACCGIDDLAAIARGNQLCNAYGLDTIGVGVTIAWAMELYERGLITDEYTDELPLNFGNTETMLTLIERIAHREGLLGATLANGTRWAARTFAHNSLDYAVQIKGQEVAMHDPRVKYGHGLGIAVSPTGADHMHSVHDSGYQTAGGITDLKPLGVLEPLPFDDLSTAKAMMVRKAMLWRVTHNLLGTCMFHAWTPEQTAELIQAATGWNTSVMELWLAAERAYDLARVFNAREGFGPDDDMLPPRLFETPTQGPIAGKVYTREEFVCARDTLYALMGWDPATAAPTRAKLEDLGVGWAADLL
jgi:aldehyde:ferredoxin oxidoreductase